VAAPGEAGQRVAAHRGRDRGRARSCSRPALGEPPRTAARRAPRHARPAATRLGHRAVARGGSGDEGHPHRVLREGVSAAVAGRAVAGGDEGACDLPIALPLGREPERQQQPRVRVRVGHRQPVPALLQPEGEQSVVEALPLPLPLAILRLPAQVVRDASARSRPG
jgi:hypothetical protein